MSKNSFASDMGGGIVPSDFPCCEAPAVSFDIIDQPAPDAVERYRERLARSPQPAAWVAGFLAQYVKRWAESGTITDLALCEALAVATVWQEISTARPALLVTCATRGAPLQPFATHDCQPRIVARGGAR